MQSFVFTRWFHVLFLLVAVLDETLTVGAWRRRGWSSSNRALVSTGVSAEQQITTTSEIVCANGGSTGGGGECLEDPALLSTRGGADTPVAVVKEGEDTEAVAGEEGAAAASDDSAASEATSGTVAATESSSNTSSEGGAVDNSAEEADSESSVSSEPTVPSTGDGEGEEEVEEPERKEVVDEEEGEQTGASSDEFVFTLLQPNDGHESDPDGIPQRYLTMQKGDRTKAKEAYQRTVEWRAEYGADTILQRSHPNFDRVKAVFPIYLAGKDVDSHPILVQRPGLIDLDLADRNDIDTDELLYHTIYVLEYCWNVYDPNPSGVMTSLLDLKGASFGLMKKPKQVSFIKTMVSTMSAHYPSRSHKTLIINAPRWFGMLYKLVQPLMRESTRKKIVILNGGKEQDRVMREVCGDSVPLELLSDAGNDGGNGKTGIHVSTKMEPGPSSDVEQDIRAHVIRQLDRDELVMLPVLA